MKALICIPTYNEKDNVELLAREIFLNVPADCEILFIDDASPDGTGQLLEQMAAREPRIYVVHRKGKLGLASAYIQAFQWGLEKDYDWFFEMDADFSHDPAHLKDFFELIQGGQVDAICGSRYIEGGGVSNWDQRRVALSRAGSWYTTFWLSQKLYDWTGGFNAWSRKVLQALSLKGVQSRGYAFQIEMKYRTLVLGFRLVETPIVFRERRAGHSKMSGDIVREALWGVIKLRWNYEGRILFQKNPETLTERL